MAEQVNAFLYGVARALDIGATLSYINTSRIFRDDKAALASDWEAVGKDLGIAFSQYDQRDNKERTNE